MKKYDVMLFWEASICDTIMAESKDEAIEIALKRHRDRINKANKYVELYDSTSGICPEHRAEEI